MANEEYYALFKKNDDDEELIITITLPKDMKTFRRLVRAWLFIEVCSVFSILLLLPGVFLNFVLGAVTLVPPLTLLIVGYIFRTKYNELNEKIYKRFLRKDK